MFLFRKKSYSNLSDEEILSEYRSCQDMRLIEEIFNRYAKKMLGACIFYLEDKEASKDAVMQIFNKLIVNLKTYEPINFKGWLSFVVRNHCISELRKNKSLKSRHESYYEFEYEMPVEEEENKILAVSDEDMLNHLNTGLKELKERQRICIELFFLKERSYQEISKETGYSLNEVKSNIQNGKRNLKLFLFEVIKKKSSAA
ncbi:MAG: RNA polymerase sigma factor [Bacteroidota bacterium]|jgi:RNA polymerase sigma factor (sigma-70 family)